MVRGAGGEGGGAVVVGFFVVDDDGGLADRCGFGFEGLVVGDIEGLLGVGVDGDLGGWEVDAMFNGDSSKGAGGDNLREIILSYLI